MAEEQLVFTRFDEELDKLNPRGFDENLIRTTHRNPVSPADERDG